jgi:UDP-N-acetylmuramoyl-L-alanyl-D-glutamate--2,6-diaminopimelate ligase
MTTLIEDVNVLDTRGNLTSVEVTSVDFDSRAVHRGSLFCCVPGEHTDGHTHAAEAVTGGAVSLLCEHFVDLDVPQARVAAGAIRPAMAVIASSFYGHPSRAMTMVGVTGTNGKTTVTQLVGAILADAGIATGVVGTLDGARTTPEAPVLQAHLAALREDGMRAVAMEVSSHGLTQHRVDGIRFDVAAFTNLSRDHLDHHRTMEEYFEAKAMLFSPDRAGLAVVNVDDPWGRLLAERISEERLIPVRASDASDLVLSVGSSSFRWRGQRLTVPLSGRFNVENAVMAATIAASLGVGDDQIRAGLSGVSPIPGRMEVIDSAHPFSVLVDFAHTPAGLDAALSSARDLAGAARVICVFGCGGDRDQGKRPEMGGVGARWADAIVLTSDNPRGEDPDVIIEQVRSGIDEAGDTGLEVVVEPDRRRAIAVAVGLAGAGDVVVIAGKGHETTQVVGSQVLPFDDRLEAREVLATAPVLDTGRPGGSRP